MTITLDLAPEIEEALRGIAEKHGQEPAEYVKAIVHAALQAETIGKGQAQQPTDKAAVYLAWAASHRNAAPVVPLSALERENLYEERL